MLKIIIEEHPYFGHGTTAIHEYRISEGLGKIAFDKYKHELTVEFNSCNDGLRLHVDRLVAIRIQED